MKNLVENKSNIIFAVCVVLVLFIILFTNMLVSKKNINNKNLLSGKHYVEMVVKDYGNMVLELDADVAPITVTNFINLVNEKFYDGLTFHRIIEGFMVQGGDPEGTGMGGSKKTIKGEFSQNGIENNISHVRGTISMARSANSFDSASSQFFIMHKDNIGLDGQYAAFGKVVSGIEVVDKLVTVKVEDNNGTVLKENQPIIESMRKINVYETSSES